MIPWVGKERNFFSCSLLVSCFCLAIISQLGQSQSLSADWILPYTNEVTFHPYHLHYDHLKYKNSCWIKYFSYMEREALMTSTRYTYTVLLCYTVLRKLLCILQDDCSLFTGCESQ